jgi:hypothetical protein
MTGEVTRAAIGLHLDDDPGGNVVSGQPMDQEAAEKVPRDAQCGSVVEESTERSQRSSTANRTFFFSIPSTTMSRPPLRIIHSRR